jgi:transcriptional regulator with XRE-family HTH domain
MKKLNGLNVSDSLAELFPDLAQVAEDRRGLAELASALVQLRSRTGQKQSEVAARAGVPATLISELENARNEGVTWRTIVRLAKGMGATIELRFALDSDNAGSVSVSVEGDYADSARIATDHVATLIDERGTPRARRARSAVPGRSKGG